jgi:hypothetical protein
MCCKKSKVWLNLATRRKNCRKAVPNFLFTISAVLKNGPNVYCSTMTQLFCESHVQTNRHICMYLRDYAILGIGCNGNHKNNDKINHKLNWKKPAGCLEP